MDELTEILGKLPSKWQRDLETGDLAVIESGMSGAWVLRVGAPDRPHRYLKIADGSGAPTLRDEIARTRWLAQRRVRVPGIFRTFETETVSAVLMSAVPGVQAFSQPENLARDIKAVAQALRQLHALPLLDCPFDETVPARLARARGEIDRGAVDADHFDVRNAGMAAGALWERLAAAIPREEFAVVHGDAMGSNILVDAEGNVGFIDCGRAGRSDRYTDLALVMEELNGFGREPADAFLRAYGIVAWDRRKALFFLDLYELF